MVRPISVPPNAETARPSVVTPVGALGDLAEGVGDERGCDFERMPSSEAACRPCTRHSVHQ